MADDAQRAHPRKEAHLRAEERSASTVTGGSALVRGIVPGGALQPLFPDAFARVVRRRWLCKRKGLWPWTNC